MTHATTGWERPPFRRLVVGACALALLAMAVYLVVGVVNREAGVAAGLVIAIGLALTARREARWRAASRTVLTLGSAFGLAFPVLVSAFAHISDERYLWVISQHGVCAHLGSAAVLVLSGAVGICFAFGAVGLLIATKRPLEPLGSTKAIQVAGVVIFVLGAIVVGKPEILVAALCS